MRNKKFSNNHLYNDVKNKYKFQIPQIENSINLKKKKKERSKLSS